MTAGACTFVLRGERVLPDRQNPPRPTALLRPGALCKRAKRDEQAGRLRLERGQRRRTLAQGGAMAWARRSSLGAHKTFLGRYSSYKATQVRRSNYAERSFAVVALADRTLILTSVRRPTQRDPRPCGRVRADWKRRGRPRSRRNGSSDERGQHLLVPGLVFC